MMVDELPKVVRLTVWVRGLAHNDGVRLNYDPDEPLGDLVGRVLRSIKVLHYLPSTAWRLVTKQAQEVPLATLAGALGEDDPELILEPAG